MIVVTTDLQTTDLRLIRILSGSPIEPRIGDDVGRARPVVLCESKAAALSRGGRRVGGCLLLFCQTGCLVLKQGGGFVPWGMPRRWPSVVTPVLSYSDHALSGSPMVGYRRA